MATAPPTDNTLAGIGVLVTRPAHQAGTLCERIAAKGGNPVAFPALEIAAPADPAPAQELLRHLDQFHILIFISPNAVQQGLALLPDGQLPNGLKVAAVGKGTARALAQAGVAPVLVPEGQSDSEALLAQPELQAVQERCILIVRGEGGRALLGDTLRQRGARVSYAEVYRRQRPDADTAGLLRRWPDDVQIVTSTSNDILDNLAAMLGEKGIELLRRTPLIVISERMVERAQSLGCRDIILADGADDVSLMAALERWAQEKRTVGHCSR